MVDPVMPSGSPRRASAGHAIRELPGRRAAARAARPARAGGLTAAELIALLWGSGVRGRSAVDLATDALAGHDGLAGLARANELELAGIPGIGAGQGRPARGGLRARSAAAWPTGRPVAGRSAARTTSPSG